MCDYSLAAMQTRLAVEGEELSVYRFPSGSLGLTSPAELERCKPELRGWRSWFNPRQAPCAVCIPPGARLLLFDIPKRLQQQRGLGPSEQVTFIQTNATPGRHRDGVRFRNNQEILLQHLAEGQRVVVLSLASQEDSAPVEQMFESEELARQEH
ncbi:MAG TPA: hypothetical protein VKV74_00815 [Bryobacteraceae bacterium]|nr:hypothetical protein [Bryobacteraceae bacterium]